MFRRSLFAAGLLAATLAASPISFLATTDPLETSSALFSTWDAGGSADALSPENDPTEEAALNVSDSLASLPQIFQTLDETDEDEFPSSDAYWRVPVVYSIRPAQ